jgi:hypothetical protein
MTLCKPLFASFMLHRCAVTGCLDSHPPLSYTFQVGPENAYALSNLHRFFELNRNGVLDGADEIIANC